MAHANHKIDERENDEHRKQQKNCFHVPQRFADALGNHVLKQMLNLPVPPPLFFGVHGRPGVGKSFQAQLVLERLGVRILRLTAADMESAEAGEPAKLIQRTYCTASQILNDAEFTHAALLVEDVDCTLGRLSDLTQTTINTQLVTAELMAIADAPVRVGGVSTKRIPVFFTGNNLARVYAPLARTGRMELFYWEPTSSEQTRIAAGLMPWLPESTVAQLVSTLVSELGNEELTPSFFAHLCSHLTDESLRETVGQAGGLVQAIERIAHGGTLELSQKRSLPEIIEAARHLARSRELQDHLKDHRW